MDDMNSVMKWLDHNRYLVVGVLLGALPLALSSCGVFEGKALSKITGEESTAEEIYVAAETRLEQIEGEIENSVREYNALIASSEREIEAANIDTERRTAMARAVYDAAMTNPVIAGTVGTLGLGAIGGLVFDNRRKDVAIKRTRKEVA